MKIVFFLLRIRLINLFVRKRNDNYINIGINLLLLFISLIYGIILGSILNFFLIKNVAKLNIALLITGLVLGITLLSVFFPRFSTFDRVFQFQYPLDNKIKALLHVFYYLVTPLNFNLTLMLLVAGFVCVNFTVFDSIDIFIVIFIGTIVAQTIKLFLSYTKIYWIVLFVFLILYGLFYLLFMYNIPLLQLTILIITSFFLMIAFVYAYAKTEVFETKLQTKISAIKSDYGMNLIFSLFNKPNSRVILITGFVFKTFWIVVLSFGKAGNVSTDFKFMVYPLFASPLIYFTYCFNNLFGFHPQLFFLVGYQETLKKVLHLYLSIIGIVLVFDLFFSILNLFIIGFSVYTLIFLILANVNCLLIGFISSLLAPKKIVKAFDFSGLTGNTNIFSILLLIGLMLFLFYFKQNVLVVLVTQSVVLGSFYFLFYKSLQNNQRKIYQKVIKTVL